MGPPSRFEKQQKATGFENQQKAVEKKKALSAQMQANLRAKKDGLGKPNAAALASAADNPPAEGTPPLSAVPVTKDHPRFGGAGIRLYQDHAEVPLVAAAPLARLVDVYLDAAANKTAHQVLLWPVAPQVLPLVHVLATMEHWDAGSKAGIRGLFFPAKDNTFNPLNHLALDRDDLARHAQELYKAKLLPDKDPILSRAVNTKEVLPTINDLIPHFRCLKKGDFWASYEDRLLEHTLKKVNRYSEKAALRSNCKILGAPKTAPDALFAFGYQLDRDDLREGFHTLENAGRPDVCLVNATRALRLTVPTWQGLLRQFFGAYLAAYSEKRPGLVVVTDDPGVSFRVRELVEKEVERATKHNPKTMPLRLAFKPLACQEGGELGQCLKPQGLAEPAAPEPRKFRVEVKDADAARVVKSLYQIRQDLKLDEQATRPLSEAANFLHKLTALPAGNRDVEAWLDEREADAGLRRKLAWSTPRGAVVEFIARGHGGACESKLEATLKIADKLVENYLDATPMAMALVAEAGAAAGGATRVAIVFTRPMHRLLAERYLQRQSFANGKAYTDIAPHLQLVSTKRLREQARSGWATRYVFVGIDDEALRALMTENNIPADSVLLLTQRTALYTRWTLKSIFDQDEFHRFKPRLEHILRQIDRRLNEHDIPLLRMDDFVLPSFDFSASSPSREDDPEAWRIVLEGGDSLYRSAGAPAYVYDPIADLSSKSGFIDKEVRSLEVGQQLFVMPDSLRDQVEDVLQRAGVPIEHDKPFEKTLRLYHQTILRNLKQRFPGKNLAAQVAALKEQLVQQFPDQAKDFSNVRHWVNLVFAPDTPFDELRPQAPRRFKVFAAFTSALGLSTADAAYFWQAAIHPIRVNRRIDGRYVSDVYARILFDPESAIVHAKLSSTDIASLFTEARRNVYTIVAVEPPATSEAAT